VELFPPAPTRAPVAPAGALPLPACTLQVPAGTAAPYGLFGTAPLAVPPTMVSSYTAPLVCQPYPASTYTGMGLVATTAVNYGGSAPYPAYVPGIVPGFPSYGTHNLSASMQPVYSPGSLGVSPPSPTFPSVPAPAVRVALPESNSDSQVGGGDNSGCPTTWFSCSNCPTFFGFSSPGCSHFFDWCCAVVSRAAASSEGARRVGDYATSKGSG